MRTRRARPRSYLSRRHCLEGQSVPSSNPCRNHWGQLHSERKRGGGASAGGMAPPKPQTGSPRLPSARRSCSAYALGWGCHAVLRGPQTPPQEAANKQLFRRRACPFPASWEAVRVWGGGSHPWGTRLGGSPAPEGTSPRLLPPTQQKPCWGPQRPTFGCLGRTRLDPPRGRRRGH